jgi:hypothetical protein
MPESLSELLRLSRTVEGAAVPQYPDVDRARQDLLDRIRETTARLVPGNIAAWEREHGWAASFGRTMQAYEKAGLFTGPDADDAVTGKAEMKRNAPTFGGVIDALKERPELLTKVEQGFVRVHPVPLGLPPSAFKEPLGKMFDEYHEAGKLRSTDGTKLALKPSEPVWMWEEYKGADQSGQLVYFPERFDPANHGGKTKKELLAGAKFPGWQVLLLENLRDIPREGQGKTVGGRAQMEANRTPRDYLEMLRSAPYAQERGLTPEAWMSLLLAHLAETQGEVLDDYQSGSACFLPGAYFPASGSVPFAYWYRVGEQAGVVRRDPGDRGPYDGVRSAVRVV